MAIVTHQPTGTRTTDPDAVRQLLEQHGVVYERWDISRLQSRPCPEGVAIEDHILDVFAPEVKAVSEQRGYRTADVVALKPEMPNLDELLRKFEPEHTHSEDEVRFTVAGRGVFSIRGQDGDMYDVEVHPGDLLAVPEGTRHAFTLCEDRHIQCIRLFTDTSGWVAHYVDESA
mgnify:CR=1 FL=1